MSTTLRAIALSLTVLIVAAGLGHAQLVNLWIDGDRVVYDPQNHKYFYPHLSDMFDMVLSEQLDFIAALEHAGIGSGEWRIGLYWDTVPLKESMFGSHADTGCSGYRPRVTTSAGVGMGAHAWIQ